LRKLGSKRWCASSQKRQAGTDAADSWGEEFIEKLVAGFPIPRIGRPEEIAEMIHFIACEKGAYITGKVFQVDGGQHISG
jgi:acetoacetyl-CoA reductase